MFVQFMSIWMKVLQHRDASRRCTHDVISIDNYFKLILKNWSAGAAEFSRRSDEIIIVHCLEIWSVKLINVPSCLIRACSIRVNTSACLQECWGRKSGAINLLTVPRSALIRVVKGTSYLVHLLSNGIVEIGPTCTQCMYLHICVCVCFCVFEPWSVHVWVYIQIHWDRHLLEM